MKRLIYVCMCLMLLTACSSSTVEISGFSMDAPYSVKGEGISPELQAQVKEYIQSGDSIFSVYQEDSYLSGLNHHKKLAVSADDKKAKELYDLIEKTLPYCNQFFDISIRPVTKLWDFTSEVPALPDEAEITENLKAVNPQNIILEDDFIYLENNAEIELGAVAKGYVCDQVANMLGEEEAIVDIGGTVKALGKDITAGVKSPLKDGLLCSFTLPKGMAVATSGAYERSFTYENTQYHHILNPKTGYPVDSPYVSVSVISDSALVCDILSTTLFAMKTPEIPAGVEVICVTKDNRVFVTDGIKNLKLFHTEYRVVNSLQE